MSIEDIEDAIKDALADNFVVTVTGSKTSGSGVGDTINIQIRSDRKLTWDAELDFECSLYLEGRGSFTATSASVIDVYVFTIEGESIEAEINCDVSAYRLYMNKNAVVTINGDVTIDGPNSYMQSNNNAIVTINGDVAISGNNSRLRSDAGHTVMTINGDVTLDGNYCYAYLGGTTVINGNISFDGDYGTLRGCMGNDSVVVINGNITLNGYSNGVESQDRVVFTINGNITLNGDECYIYAQNRPVTTFNGIVSFNGDKCNINTQNRAALTFNGNVTFDGKGSFVYLQNDSSMTFNSGLTFNGDDCYMGVGAEGDGNVALTITGNVTFDGDDCYIDVGKKGKDNFSTFILNGNLTTNGSYAIRTFGTVSVLVNGNITSENTGILSDGGKVVINGTLTADPDQYIGFWDDDASDYVFKPKADSVGVLYVYDGSDIVGEEALVSFNVGTGTQTTPAPDDDDGGSNLWLIIVAVIAVAAVAGFAIWFLKFKK